MRRCGCILNYVGGAGGCGDVRRVGLRTQASGHAEKPAGVTKHNQVACCPSRPPGLNVRGLIWSGVRESERGS